MNQKHLIWINPHAPVTAKPAPRRRRSKLMFQEERQIEATEEAEQSDAAYKQRRLDKRGIKS